MNFDTHFLFSAIVISVIVTTAYSQNNDSVSARDSFVLACGFLKPATDSIGRNWNPDSKFLINPEHPLTANAPSQDPSLPSTVPYMNARIFKSISTYNFSISPKYRHWVRLHFYPSSYGSFNCDDSYFSVTAGGFTLLNNFSASITARALTQAYIVREFSLIPIQNGSLTLTFAPKNGSFAFINGIEIISMPKIFKSAPMVGSSLMSLPIENSTVQTMYRLNVGGQYIPPTDDSELTRTWYDDSPYIYGAGYGVTSQADKSVTIVYPDDVPRYIAPVNVYRTARSMGPSSDVNKNYNLSWVFGVDGNFTYLVRLHFCEFLLDKVNQRVFAIYINNQTAYPFADVIAWALAKDVPVYKDYAVYVRDRDGDEELWVTLRPNVLVKPQYYDAILNGLEIFKMNDINGNLVGRNPVPPPVPPPVSRPKKSNSNHNGLIVGSVVGGVAGFGLLAGLIFYINHRKKDHLGNWLPIHGSLRLAPKSTTSGNSSGSLAIIGSGLCRHFTLADLKLGTNNFDESQVIGIGGFGKVYKGIIDGRINVAIKRANPSSQQGIDEFQTEIDLLSKLRHRHLVSLIGACEEDEEMILVYDYMANGTLREHLYRTNNPLSWNQRLEICIGAARGLHYLHTGAKHTIIHRDVKTTNILLDEKWVAKVSDFGLSKMGHTVHQTHVSTMVKGSFGYLDPEYFRRQQLTEKSDVYSLGVVLFEVLCGRSALSPSLPKEQVSLADWALQCHEMGTLEHIIDPHIREDIRSECLMNFTDTAVKCLSDQGTERPSMGTVLWNLEFALQLQKNPDAPKLVVEQKANDAYAMHTMVLSVEEEGEGSSEGQSNNAIFSELVNPQGR